MIRELDAAMETLARVVRDTTGCEIASIPYAGATGGLGAGLVAFCRANLVSGVDYILDAVRFDDALQACDIVLTAEGSLDSQTQQGKAIAGIAARARAHRKPVHVLAGRLLGNPATLCRTLGLASVRAISPKDLPLADAMTNARQLLNDATELFQTEVRKARQR